MLTISHNTTITGDIRSPGPIQISGNVQGNGTFDDLLIVTKSCIWEGNIVADSIIVDGVITGNIIGRKKIQISSSAEIIGNISTLKLTIGQGAKIEGYVDMKPMPKPIALNDQKTRKQIEYQKDHTDATADNKEAQVKKLA